MLNYKKFKKERKADKRIKYIGNYKFTDRIAFLFILVVGLIIETSINDFEWLYTKWLEYLITIFFLYIIIRAIVNIDTILKNQKSILEKLYED